MTFRGSSRGLAELTKYGNRKTEVAGLLFDSGTEADLFVQLRALQQAGKIYELKRQVRFLLTVASVKIATIVVDFTYWENGKQFIHEAKGYPTRDWVIKWKLAKALYPEWEFRLN